MNQKQNLTVLHHFFLSYSIFIKESFYFYLRLRIIQYKRQYKITKLYTIIALYYVNFKKSQIKTLIAHFIWDIS